MDWVKYNVVDHGKYITNTMLDQGKYITNAMLNWGNYKTNGLRQIHHSWMAWSK